MSCPEPPRRHCSLPGSLGVVIDGRRNRLGRFAARRTRAVPTMSEARSRAGMNFMTEDSRLRAVGRPDEGTPGRRLKAQLEHVRLGHRADQSGRSTRDSAACRAMLAEPFRDSLSVTVGLRVRSLDGSVTLSPLYRAEVAAGIRELLHFPQPLPPIIYTENRAGTTGPKRATSGGQRCSAQFSSSEAGPSFSARSVWSGAGSVNCEPSTRSTARLVGS